MSEKSSDLEVAGWLKRAGTTLITMGALEAEVRKLAGTVSALELDLTRAVNTIERMDKEMDRHLASIDRRIEERVELEVRRRLDKK